MYDRYKVERAELESRFAAEYGAIYSQRADVVAGRGTNADGERNRGDSYFTGHSFVFRREVEGMFVSSSDGEEEVLWPSCSSRGRVSTP